MKKALLLSISIVSFSANAQQVISRNDFLSAISAARDSSIAQINDSSRLVSEYAFRTLVRNDYSTLLTGEKNKTNFGRTASLEIDKIGQTVSLTPIAYTPGNDAIKAPFRWIFSLDLKASTNSKGIFEWKERTKATAGITITLIDGKYAFDDEASVPADRKRGFWIFRDTAYTKPPLSRYYSVYQTIYNRFVAQYEKMNGLPDSIDLAASGGSKEALQKAYFEKVAEYENALTARIWNVKRLMWIKTSFNLASFDRFHFIALSDSGSFRSPIDTAFYNPSLQVSGNIYWLFKRYGSLYLNGWGRLIRKTSLSEVANARSLRKISPLADSVYFQDLEKNVFVLSGKEIETRVLPDFGAQVVYMLPSIKKLKNVSVGIDINASIRGFISPDDRSSQGQIFVNSIGLVLPFKDKSGQPSINVEPFSETIRYWNYNKAKEQYYGVRFSLPFKTVLK